MFKPSDDLRILADEIYKLAHKHHRFSQAKEAVDFCCAHLRLLQRYYDSLHERPQEVIQAGPTPFAGVILEKDETLVLEAPSPGNRHSKEEPYPHAIQRGGKTED